MLHQHQSFKQHHHPLHSIAEMCRESYIVFSGCHIYIIMHRDVQYKIFPYPFYLVMATNILYYMEHNGILEWC